MWTEDLTIYSAIVATTSLSVACLSYRSAGPRLSGDAEISNVSHDEERIRVCVYNRGRGPITIDSIILQGRASSKKFRGQLKWPLSLHPSRIEGNSKACWEFPANFVTEEWFKLLGFKRLELRVYLATGKVLKLKVNTLWSKCFTPATTNHPKTTSDSPTGPSQ